MEGNLMNVLGIHIGHDSSVALVVDGKIIADVAEERFIRAKHYAGLPIKSLKYCLEAGDLSIEDIDFIAIPSKKDVFELNYLLKLSKDKKQKMGPRTAGISYVQRVLGVMLKKTPIYIESFPVAEKTEIVHVEHHLAHAASAYYTSGITEKQLIVTIDGAGDGVSVCLWTGENGKIKPLKKILTSGSLGWFYSNVTEALGWWHGDGEGKTMGLAPYGDFNKCKGVLDRFYPKFKNGNLVESHDFGKGYYWNELGALQYHFEEANQIKKLIEIHGSENIAAEAQRILEEQIIEIILPWLEKEKTNNLCCAGGVFLNVKLNQRVWETGKVKNHHIFPNAGDSGLAIGAALWTYYDKFPNAEIDKIEHLYYGAEYSNDEIKNILDARNLTYQYVENVEREAAKYLANNKIVAWFQGRMESGPRALGNRSILMSPLKAENKDIINARVKFREAFRPFCPSLIEEKKDIYLKNNRLENFMITSFDVTDDKRDKIPAIVHVDGTLRPQTVSKKINPRYWNLINEFGNLTGEYILLNTSMNIAGEPIVCNPREAIRCFYDNGIDYLILGNYLLEK